MLLDWDGVSQDHMAVSMNTYVTLIDGASLGGGKTSRCCFDVEENSRLPRGEVCGRRR
jgi:hypothetical protein